MTKVAIRANWDVLSKPVRVHAANQSLGALDMTFSGLRAPSQSHRVFLNNLGARASLTMNIVVDGVLYESADSYAAARIAYLQNRRASLKGEVNEADIEDPFAFE